MYPAPPPTGTVSPLITNRTATSTGLRIPFTWINSPFRPGRHYPPPQKHAQIGRAFVRLVVALRNGLLDIHSPSNTTAAILEAVIPERQGLRSRRSMTFC